MTRIVTVGVGLSEYAPSQDMRVLIDAIEELSQQQQQANLLAFLALPRNSGDPERQTAQFSAQRHAAHAFLSNTMFLEGAE